MSNNYPKPSIVKTGFISAHADDEGVTLIEYNVIGGCSLSQQIEFDDVYKVRFPLNAMFRAVGCSIVHPFLKDYDGSPLLVRE